MTKPGRINKRRIAKENRKKERDNQRKEKIERSIKIGYWNTNGVRGTQKLETVSDIISNGELDIISLDETHLREGNNIDLQMMEDHEIITQERRYGEKQGGGRMIVIKKNLNYMFWEPVTDQECRVSKERAWILIHENNSRVALCFIYCAAEVTNNDEYKVWNAELYGMLGREVITIRERGYTVITLGDMNAHIGNGQEGITGNKPGINSNGRMFLQHIETNQMHIVNRV